MSKYRVRVTALYEVSGARRVLTHGDVRKNTNDNIGQVSTFSG